MVASSLLLGMIILPLAFYLLNAVLPNFAIQKRFEQKAEAVIQSEAERKKQELGAFVYYVSRTLIPAINRKVNLESLFGQNIRIMYRMLGTNETFEEKLAKSLRFSLLFAPLGLTLPWATGITFLYSTAVILPVLFFVAQVLEIKVKYKQRQTEIIRDLPNLIDKMMIALEAGKPFLNTFQQVEKTSGPRMAAMLKTLIANMQNMKATDAIELFAIETGIPVMREFSTAVRIGLEQGYTEAQERFLIINDKLRFLRKTALEELTRNKPEKMKLLYAILVGHALVAVIMAFVQIFAQLGTIL